VTTAVLTTARGVLASPPTTGLVASAPAEPDDGVRWEQGIAWVPERCGADYQRLSWCSVDDPDDYPRPRAGGAYYRPVGARIADECSTLGGALDEERLRRIAEATAPFIIARELWDGLKGQEDSWTAQGATYSNAYLASADATVVGSGGSALLKALAALEQAAMEATLGQHVMIHLPIIATAGLAESVHRVGARLLTRQDNFVVVDAGYPGTGPAGQAVGATAWAYATPIVQVRRSPLQILTEPPQIVDRSSNTITAWAEFVFAATFDPCAHFATEITL
jgi:hypothetical protein